MHVNDTLYARIGNVTNFRFYTYDDLANFLKHIKRISIPPFYPNTQNVLIKNNTNTPNELVKPIEMKQHPHKFKKFIEFIKSILHTNKKNANNITVNIQNQNITTNLGKNYLEYDVFISANNSNNRFAGIFLSVGYNPINI